ncbi:MAG: PEP-CTERM sorting domain-containing protein, partial [Planctomycetota bacterium]
ESGNIVVSDINRGLYILRMGEVDGVGGDFNADEVYDCEDIDALVGAIVAGENDLSFDLTGDGTLDIADVDAWLAEAGAANLSSGNAYLRGDANLDGVVDVSDFGVWNTFKFTQTGAWCEADFNADGVTDTSDFNAWNANKFQSSNDAAPVPEPGTGILAFFGIGSLLLRRRN